MIGPESCLNLLELARLTVQRALRPGALAVDATAGNGYDTIFLARLVGERGIVLSFESQAKAVESTRDRLAEAGLEERVRLLHTGHEHMADYLPALDYGLAGHPARVSAAMFNLGFLPGSDKRVITRPATTLAALRGLLPFMQNRGVIAVHCYSGHQGGREESEAILTWAAERPRAEWRIYRYDTFNKKKARENLILLERREACCILQ
ncbi:MAG: hypothetical protein LBJ14_03170 [Desulfarculales bacterium]|jgi:hypothetical protein|nr:hypothetical protein [Desulfarculales bacterium]